jgi:hypothetical protein
MLFIKMNKIFLIINFNNKIYNVNKIDNKAVYILNKYKNHFRLKPFPMKS